MGWGGPRCGDAPPQPALGTSLLRRREIQRRRITVLFADRGTDAIVRGIALRVRRNRGASGAAQIGGVDAPPCVDAEPAGDHASSSGSSSGMGRFE